MRKIYLLVLIAVAMLGLTGCQFVKQEVIEKELGGTTKGSITLSSGNLAVTSGTLTVGGESQMQRVVQGGTVTNASTTMTSALTLTAAQVCNSSVITVNSAATADTLSDASLNVTLPATSTLFADCLDTEGDHIRFIFANLSPTAATTTQIVAGTGMDLLEPDDSSAFDVEIAGGARAIIEIWRTSDAIETNIDAIATVLDLSAAD